MNIASDDRFLFLGVRCRVSCAITLRELRRKILRLDGLCERARMKGARYPAYAQAR